MTDEKTDERGVPRLLSNWSRRYTVWASGIAALAAATTAAAVVAASDPAPASAPTSHTSAATTTAAGADALDAIIGKNSDLAKPVSELVKQGKVPKPSYAGDIGTVGVPKGVIAPEAAAGSVPQFNAGSLSGSFSLVQMAALALQAGCSASQAPIAAAIGAAESAGNPGAQGDITLMDGTWDWSEGLWQVRGLKSERGTGGLRDSVANADPTKNARAMMAISSGCTNWTPWSTFNTGAYLSYLNLSRSAALAAQKYHDQTGEYPPIGAGAAATVPSATSSATTPARRSPTHRPTPSKSRSAVHGTPAGARASTSAPATQGRPAPRPSSTRSTPKSSPSITPPTSSLPIKVPTKLPTKLPTQLPTKSPTLPVPVPSLSLPRLP